jgi:hypothetical protein
MAITVSWHNQSQSIIRWDFGSTWTWDEFYSSIERTNRMLDQVVHQVAVIVDTRAMQTFPRGVMTHAMNAVTARPSNASMVVVLIENATLRVLFNSFMHMIQRVLPKGTFELQLAEDVENAARIIREAQANSAK